MKRSMLSGLVVAALLLGYAGPASAQWGDLKGKFVVDGKAPANKVIQVTKDQEAFGKEVPDDSLVVSEDGAIANVVIYVNSKITKVNPEIEKELPKTVKMDNVKGRFVPHVLLVDYKRQSLVLFNSDSVAHNSNVQPLGDKPANPLLAANGGMQDHKFSRQQTAPVPVACNIHPWMKGYILPRDNPYMAVTNEKGEFTIKGLPVGEHEFRVWHDPAFLALDKTDKGKFKMKIKEGENTLPFAGKDGEVKVPLKLLQK